MGLLLVKTFTPYGRTFLFLCICFGQVHTTAKKSLANARLFLSGWSRLRRDDLHKVGVAGLTSLNLSGIVAQVLPPQAVASLSFLLSLLKYLEALCYKNKKSNHFRDWIFLVGVAGLPTLLQIFDFQYFNRTYLNQIPIWTLGLNSSLRTYLLCVIYKIKLGNNFQMKSNTIL